MTRTALKDRVLPDYTRGEEIFNMVSHIVGGACSIAATVLCIVVAALHSNSYGVVGSAIYGFTMMFVYTMSSIYHGLSSELTAKKVFQVLDHCSIFLLIAGTYTPILLSSIRVAEPVTAWSLLAVLWGIATIGIVLNSIDLKRYKIISMICYLIMGWCIIFKIKLLYQTVGINAFMLILLGGVCYTIGALIYAVNKKKHTKYMHSIFHLAVVLASVLQFFAIVLYVL